jgi:mono/diheme cytochrome c family protein
LAWGAWLLGGAAVVAASDGKTHPLVWEATTVTHQAKAGEEAVDMVFAVTNKSDGRVEILDLQPSCGCTLAEMPARPWVLEPGARGTFRATVDFKGKEGVFTKTIQAVSRPGTQILTLRVEIPDTEETRRRRNQMLAQVDRQAVFRGDCAACHVTPTVGKFGGELFMAACGICHTAPHRASMVPDLGIAREPRSEAWWRKWITEGKAGTLMPGFAAAHGGPLTPEQIESLIAYALKHLPTQAAAH